MFVETLIGFVYCPSISTFAPDPGPDSLPRKRPLTEKGSWRALALPQQKRNFPLTTDMHEMTPLGSHSFGFQSFPPVKNQVLLGRYNILKFLSYLHLTVIEFIGSSLRTSFEEQKGKIRKTSDAWSEKIGNLSKERKGHQIGLRQQNKNLPMPTTWHPPTLSALHLVTLAVCSPTHRDGASSTYSLCELRQETYLSEPHLPLHRAVVWVEG